jgi:hypothetical protein
LGLTGVTGEEFTITLAIAGRGESRAVAGPSAGTIQYGSIRNVAQVIVRDTGGTIAAFQQVRRTASDGGTAKLSVNIPLGQTYHFLILMGRQPYENDYAYDDTNPPTLLAAGFATAAVTEETGSISITMKPVVVDTVFTYGGTEQGASLGGVTLPQGADAAITWKVTSGFAPLIDAQNAGSLDAWNGLWHQGISIVPAGTNGDPLQLGGAEFNEITAAIDTGSEEKHWVNFNLAYAPFNLSGKAWSGVTGLDEVVKDGGVPAWTIRNGVNDTAQNPSTDFNPGSGTSLLGPLWHDETKNGNGAVVFTVEDVLPISEMEFESGW